jgi:hypothetical protein
MNIRSWRTMPQRDRKPEPVITGAHSMERWGAWAALALYAAYYFADAAVPGNMVEYPLGWWGWWDQSKYLESARNLLSGNLTPQGHWYPLGYSILAAPFVAVWPAHGFFFLDLGCLSIAYAGFLAFTRRIGIRAFPAVLIFLVTTFAYPSIAETWVEPWTSTLSAALIWSALGCAAALLQGHWQRWRVLLLGLLASCLPLVRPPDLILSTIVVVTVLAARMRGKKLPLADLGWMAAGAAAVVLPYFALYLRIYGFRPTPYMDVVRDVGFVFSRLGWKTYLLLIAPRPWYPFGQSLLTVFPWLVMSFAEILLTIFLKQQDKRRLLVLLIALIVVHWTLYFAFTDLLPSGIWRFHLIHYLKWTLPALGLFAWLFVERAWREPRWYHAATPAILILLLSIRVTPERASAGEKIEMVQYPGPKPSLQETYLRDWQFYDDIGDFGMLGARALPDEQGFRVLPQRRPIVGDLRWRDGPVDPGRPEIRWKSRISFGYPCWLPPYPCQRLQPPS